MATIDLDDAWEAPEHVPLSSSWRRGLAIAACLVLVLVSATGSIPPRPLLLMVASLPASISDDFQMTDDRVYLFSGGRVGTPGLLRAYGLPDGRERWRTTLPRRVDSITSIPATDIVVAQMYSDNGVESIAALAAGTGRVLWQIHDTFVRDLSPDGGLLLLSISQPRVMRVIEPRTGATRWSRQLEANTDLALTGAGRLIVQSFGGLTEILDEDTGGVLATRRLPAVSASASADGLAVRNLVVAGDHLVVMDSYLSSELVSEYDLATMTPGWQTRLDMPVTAALDCAPRLCLSGQDNTTGQPDLTVLDPDTGAAIWHSTAWAWADPFGRWLIASAANGTEQALLDPPTGRGLIDLDRWSPLSRPRSVGPVLLTGPRAGRLGVWVAALDKDHLTVRPLAWLPDAVQHQCSLNTTVPAYLACGTRQGGIHIWRIGSI